MRTFIVLVFLTCIVTNSYTQKKNRIYISNQDSLDKVHLFTYKCLTYIINNTCDTTNLETLYLSIIADECDSCDLSIIRKNIVLKGRDSLVVKIDSVYASKYDTYSNLTFTITNSDRKLKLLPGSKVIWTGNEKKSARKKRKKK